MIFKISIVRIELPIALTLRDISNIVGGDLVFYSNSYYPDESFTVRFLSTDTREDVEGTLFVPLYGKNFDGHNFIETAFNKGAIASLSSRKEMLQKLSKIPRPVIFVENTHEALLKLGVFIRRKISPYVISVGGSAGKTTTKELIHFMLSDLGFKVTKSRKSFNNEIGLAFSLLDLKNETEIAVLEIGTSRKGEIEYLCKFADPDSAVLLSVGKEHLEGLESENGIFEEETSLIKYVLAHSGVCILNIGELRLKDFFFSLNTEKKIAFAGERVDVGEIEKISKLVVSYPLSVSRNFKTEFRVEVYEGRKKETFTIFSNLAPHFSSNIAGAISSIISYGWSRGVDLIYNLKGIDFEKFRNEPHRFSVFEINNTILVDDTYNSNPVSLSSLFYSASFVSGKKFFVLGDMLELGIFSENEHYSVGDLASRFLERDRTLFFLLGSFAQNMKKGLESKSFEALVFESEKELVETLVSYFRKRTPDYVFFKASRGCKFEIIFEEFVDRIYGKVTLQDRTL